jgi:hypothetical protein
MTWRTRLATIALSTSCVAAFSAAHAQQKRISQGQLPALVQTAVAQEGKGAVIRGLLVEKEQGLKVYEVELVTEGRSKNVSMDANGKVLQVEEEISMDSLPIAAQQGLALATGEGVIDKIESLTRLGAFVAYEAVVKTGAKWSKIFVGPEGKRLNSDD